MEQEKVNNFLFLIKKKLDFLILDKTKQNENLVLVLIHA